MLTQKRRNLLAQQKPFSDSLSSSSPRGFSLFWREKRRDSRRKAEFCSNSDSEPREERKDNGRCRTAYASPIHTTDLVDRAQFAAAPRAARVPEADGLYTTDEEEEGGRLSSGVRLTERARLSGGGRSGGPGGGRAGERKGSLSEDNNWTEKQEEDEDEDEACWETCGPLRGRRDGGVRRTSRSEKDEGKGGTVWRRKKKDDASVWSLLRRCGRQTPGRHTAAQFKRVHADALKTRFPHHTFLRTDARDSRRRSRTSGKTADTSAEHTQDLHLAAHATGV